MAGELLLVNPRKRHKSRKSKASRRRNPIRAKRHSPRKRSRARSRSRNPVRALRRYSRARRRRNPLSLRGMGGGLVGQLLGALKGAGGAIANDALFTYVPLPAMLKTGPLSLVTRALGAFGVGYLASFVGGKSLGARMTEGALTVLAYQTVKPMVSNVLPLAGSDIEGLGYYSPGMILQDTLSPLPDLNTGTPLQAYLNGMGANSYGGQGGSQSDDNLYDSTIDAYIN